MRILSASAQNPSTQDGLTEILGSLGIAEAGEPQLLFLFASSGHDVSYLHTELSKVMPATALHGGTSCLGVMTERDLSLDTGFGIGALAIWDSRGAYGSSAASYGSNARHAAAQATRDALRSAGRLGETPSLVWLTAAPGQEEAALAGIKDVVGESALIVGGSSADNAIEGNWKQFSRNEMCTEGLVITVMFTESSVHSVFQNGHAPSGPGGTVTSADGRRLIEIDNRPATEVYFGWLGKPIPNFSEGIASMSILAESTLFPLGIVQDNLANVPLHLLLHPATAHDDGSISLFCDVKQGDEVFLMNGTAQRLVNRAGKIAGQAKADAEARRSEVLGAIVVYCGGCMLAVKPDMEEARRGIVEALGDIPFLGLFSFGEQGSAMSGGSKHANLMISCTVLADYIPASA